MMDFICSPSLYLLYADLLTCCLLQINAEPPLQYFYDTTGGVHIIRKYGLLQMREVSSVITKLFFTDLTNDSVKCFQ